MWFEGHKLVQMIAQDKRKHDEQCVGCTQFCSTSSRRNTLVQLAEVFWSKQNRTSVSMLALLFWLWHWKLGMSGFYFCRCHCLRMARSPLCIASASVALLWFYQRLPVPLQTLTLYLLRHMLLVLSHPFTLLCPSPHQHPSSSLLKSLSTETGT